MPGKTKNMMKLIEKNIVIPEGERGHISKQRLTKLSNALRAHASQIKMSLELPVQINPLSSTRSHFTPQALLRSSQFLAFSPFEGDTPRTQRVEVEQATSFPLRLLKRHQSLLPIPERESSIHVPLSQQDKEMYFNNSSTNVPGHIEIPTEIPLNINENPETSSNIPRAVPEDVEMIDEPLLQNINNNALRIQTQQQEVLLNSSLIYEPNIPMGLAEGQSLNLPSVLSEEGTEQPTQVGSVNNLTRILPVIEEQSLLIPTSVARNNEGVAPINLDDIPPVGRRDPNFSWYEILRSRNNIPEYPLEGAARGRKRRRQRRRQRRDSEEHIFRPRADYALPDIPRSPSRENVNELPTVPTDSVVNQASNNISPNPESVTLGPLNVQPHIDVQDQMSQNPDQINLQFVDHLDHNSFAEMNLGPTVESSAPLDGITKQITGLQITEEIENPNLKTYLELVKKAGRRTDYNNWEHFDPNLFSENDNFETYTYIFKRIIKEDYVQMDTLYEKGTTRIEAAKGFRFILELKKMGLIEIEAIGTRILGFRLKSANSI